MNIVLGIHKNYNRLDAYPFGIYEDGRIEELWEDIKALEGDLKAVDEKKWKAVVDFAYEILMDDNDKEEQEIDKEVND